MADTKTTAPDPTAQFTASGYVISEDSELALREMFVAMDFIAAALDLDYCGAPFDITGDQVAAMMRTHARLGRMAVCGTPFAASAPVTRRDPIGATR